jgi:hypothetical protein
MHAASLFREQGSVARTRSTFSRLVRLFFRLPQSFPPLVRFLLHVPGPVELHHPFKGCGQDALLLRWIMATRWRKAASHRTPAQENETVPRGLHSQVSFLGGAEAMLEAGKPFRPVLAKWLTAPDNPYFARAMVNRLWAHLFGRGIAHPFDDMHEENAPSHPQLLQMLTEQFVASGYDVKHLLRAICQSDAYQRSSWPHNQKASDPEWLAYRPVRVLTPWQLFDSLQRLSLMPAESKGKKDLRKEFVNFFSSDGEPNPFAYERGIPQALRLMNATRHDSLLSEIAGPQQTAASVIEHMYLKLLARRPTAAETKRMLTHVERFGSDPRQGYSDVLWVLLQSSEFTTNH